MLKALYYPHTNITNEVILKNALLLWDKIEVIVPNSKWAPVRARDRWVNEAVDLVVEPRIPDQLEQRMAHESLISMVESGALLRLISASPQEWRNNRYLIYPEKFLNSTWHFLESQGIATFVLEDQDYGVPPALGFLMMSLLADFCAGTQIQKVTDRVDAYSWLSQQHAEQLGTSVVAGLDISQIAPAYDRLVTISLEVVDARRVPLRTLVQMRQREAKRGGNNYSQMRRKYLKQLQEHLRRVGAEVRSHRDLVELNYQFKEKLREDFEDLKAELALADLKALFSKEVALSILVAGGALILPIPGVTGLAEKIGLVGVIPLLKAAVELRGARRDALRRHTSSWLYLAKSQSPFES